MILADLLLVLIIGFYCSIMISTFFLTKPELLSLAITIDNIRFFLYYKSKRYVSDKIAGVAKTRKDYNQVYCLLHSKFAK